jgi:Tat protein secretion system quality control protein TatD with DNase activity
MLTDSHCHLASHRFDEREVSTLIAAAQHAEVNRLVTLATSLHDLQPNLHIANHPAVHACIGIHPCDVHHAPDDATSQLAAFTNDPRVCAIGETGLDYYHPAPEAGPKPPSATASAISSASTSNSPQVPDSIWSSTPATAFRARVVRRRAGDLS